MCRPRLSESGITEAVADRACGDRTIAEGALIPRRGQAVDGGRLVGAADSHWPGAEWTALVSSLDHTPSDFENSSGSSQEPASFACTGRKVLSCPGRSLPSEGLGRKGAPGPHRRLGALSSWACSLGQTPSQVELLGPLLLGHPPGAWCCVC